ncbi:MAG TPA: hypothetical protein DCP90_06525 [Clostridiales bacterium]|nr:MAG: hypothetical protein A2Y22_00750 [Clostridiales bacterium GWD2_32_59]HAN10248.1 hypothetical protein [Clostridiales bacterium]
MDDMKAKEVIDKIFASVFDCKNPFTLDEILSKFAFDIKLPQQVVDSTTGELTWASSINPTKFIRSCNSEKRDDWMQPRQPINSLEELIAIWKKINYTTTERVYNSICVSKSDNVYDSENVYRSTNCGKGKNVIFCDSCYEGEYMLASQRSGSCTFCIRVDDSGSCSNSYNVICSGSISNSLFIQDCNAMHECILCSHVSNKKYCIANMQFEEEEYYEIKKEIVKWILNS